MSDIDEKSESMILSQEEKRYYRALLAWEPSDAEEHPKQKTGPKQPAAGQFRVLILGSKGCGKTAILTRFCKGSFTGEGQPPNPEYERGCQRRIEIQDKIYVVDALELAPDQLSEGQYLRHAVAITEAVVLIYDVRSRDSFSLIKDLHRRIQEALLQDQRRHYALILVGNKADGGEDGKDENYRAVTEGEGYELACNIGYGRTRCAFRETSARTGENVDSIFVLLGAELLRSRYLARQRQEQEQDQEQAEAEGIALMRAISEADGYDADKASKRGAKWRVWSRFRRASEDATRKVAVP
ncbi:P-loop containing nucleoside triphosphate hydrolase protein [Xylaria cf. heliscus]|nr:P-loop containing nucleoside triphosphate hydrolase protein [Xylaria cf. heliscus]